MNKLSPRLLSVANYVEDNVKLIDVGCDHALLSIYLVNKYDNVKVIASDVNKNALEMASKNIKKYNLEDKIETRLGNGLDIIYADEVDTVVISGMGTRTIIEIIDKNLKKIRNIKSIIIQSNTELDVLRSYMTSHGFIIEDEDFLLDSKIYYTTIKFVLGNKRYTKKELYFGPILIKKETPLWIQKKKEEYNKLLLLKKKIPIKNIKDRISLYLKLKLFK